jgi:HK97 family phage prohead protease
MEYSRGGGFITSFNGAAFRRPAETKITSAEPVVVAGIATFYDLAHFASSGRPYEFDVFVEGCFSESIERDDVRLLRNHEKSRVFAWKNGSPALAISDVAEGVKFRVALDADDPDAVTLLEQVASGALGAASVGFRATDTQIREIRGRKCRLITKALLDEISIVANPAVPGTTAVILDQFMAQRFKKSGSGAPKIEIAELDFLASLRRLRDVVGRSA